MFGMRLNQRDAVVPQIYGLLRHAIVTTKLVPGQCLSEKNMAEQLGVSRQPVREAFIKLAEAGLVEIRPQRGTFVMKISVKAVENSRFVREAIELAILDEGVGHVSPTFLALQRDTINRQRAAAHAPDFEAFFALDEAFHRGFAEAVGCGHAWKVIENDKAQWDRVRFLTLPKASPMLDLARQHEVILDAVEQRRLDDAKAAMRTHLREALKTLAVVVAEYPQLFEDETGPRTGGELSTPTLPRTRYREPIGQV
jgi:DNA-binding GntR family transcriptional regulator